MLTLIGKLRQLGISFVRGGQAGRMGQPFAGPNSQWPRVTAVFQETNAYEYGDLVVELENVGFEDGVLLRARIGLKPQSKEHRPGGMFPYPDNRFDLLKDFISQTIRKDQCLALPVGRPAWYEDVLLLLDYEDLSRSHMFQTQFFFTTFPGRRPDVSCGYAGTPL